MSLALAVPSSTGSQAAPFKVMLVDDSVVIRGMVTRWLEAESDIKVVASARTGRDAVNQVKRADPDVVVLDIEMPDLDGISALPLLLAEKRDLVIIMASTLTRRNAEISLKALSLGASDYIPKPESTREAGAADIFRHSLIEKIRQLGKRRMVRAAPSLVPKAGAMPAPEVKNVASAIKLRPWHAIAAKALVIGSSTGGPQALMDMLGALSPSLSNVPVLVTQHMPPTFTTILAEHLARVTKRVAREGVDGEAVVPGQIYVAPGGKHMRVAREGAGAVIRLTDEGPINFCKPAVDPLFMSAAQVWPGSLMAVVLTGMGSDGARGAVDIANAGGNVIAQDEETSVVWGMPGAAAQAGTCAAVLPLNEIAPKVARLLAGGRA